MVMIVQVENLTDWKFPRQIDDNGMLPLFVSNNHRYNIQYILRNKSNSSKMPPIANPSPKRPSSASLAAAQNAEMGPQSQRRATLIERTYRQATTRKRRQAQLWSKDRAFDSELDCTVLFVKPGH